MAENSKIEWTDHTFNPWVGTYILESLTLICCIALFALALWPGRTFASVGAVSIGTPESGEFFRMVSHVDRGMECPTDPSVPCLFEAFIRHTDAHPKQLLSEVHFLCPRNSMFARIFENLDWRSWEYRSRRMIRRIGFAEFLPYTLHFLRIHKAIAHWLIDAIHRNRIFSIDGWSVPDVYEPYLNNDGFIDLRDLNEYRVWEFYPSPIRFDSLRLCFLPQSVCENDVSNQSNKSDNLHRTLDAIKAFFALLVGTVALSYGWITWRANVCDGGTAFSIVMSSICLGIGGGLLALGFEWLPAALRFAN
jgi:hypothetical protein